MTSASYLKETSRWIILMLGVICLVCHCNSSSSDGSPDSGGTGDTDTDTDSDSDSDADDRRLVLDWVQCIPAVDINTTSVAKSVLVTQQGDIYAGGEFFGGDFDNSYIVALAPDGTHIETYTAIADDTVDGSYLYFGDIAETSSGDILGIGHYLGDVTLGAQSTPDIELSAVNGDEMVLVNISAEQGLQWAKTVSSQGGCAIGLSIAVCSDGSIGVGGAHSPSTTFGEGANQQTLGPIDGATAHQHNAFIARYDESGELIWIEQAGGKGITHGWAMTCTSEGDFVTGGSTSGGDGDLYFDYGLATQMSFTPQGDSDLFAGAYSATDGSFVWADVFGSQSDSEEARALEAGPLGSIILLGEHVGSAVLGSQTSSPVDILANTQRRAVLASYSQTGVPDWAVTFGSADETTEEAEHLDMARAMAVGADDIYVAGCFTGAGIFGEGEQNETQIDAPHEAAYMARFDSDGNLLWVDTMHQAKNDYTEFRPWDMAFIDDNSLVVVGSYMGANVTMGYDSSDNTVYCDSVKDGAFIARYSF